MADEKLEPTPTEAIAARVNDLRRLADDAKKRGSVHEAEAAAKRADALIQQYRLSEADLTPETQEIILEVADTTDERKAWRQMLCYHLARHYGCTSVQVWGERDGKKYFDLQIVGQQRDIEYVKSMYAVLRLEISALGVRFYPHPRDFEKQNDYRLGVVEGFKMALDESKKNAQRAFSDEVGEERALRAEMVLVGRDVEADNALRAMFAQVHEKMGKDVNAAPTIQIKDITVFEEGRETGKKMRVDAPMLLDGSAPVPQKTALLGKKKG